MLQVPSTPPETLDDLLARADSIAGWSLGELAEMANIAIPADFKRQKGWTGQLIELWLGATAGSKPQQDFPDLGVELKTLPLSHQGTPLETTYVCYAPLLNIQGITWETSNVRNKLQTVLWVPVEGEREIPPADRRVATSILWQPSAQEDALMRADWEEIMDRIALGDVENITARHGQVLQLRPKAADGSALTDAIGSDGTKIKTRPRGFYLKKTFTQGILKAHFSQ